MNKETRRTLQKQVARVKGHWNLCVSGSPPPMLSQVRKEIACWDGQPGFWETSFPITSCTLASPSLPPSIWESGEPSTQGIQHPPPTHLLVRGYREGFMTWTCQMVASFSKNFRCYFKVGSKLSRLFPDFRDHPECRDHSCVPPCPLCTS